jgi:Ras-related GTP-binding protein C/D
MSANCKSRYLCLVTVIKNDEAKDKKGLIDYNCHIFQDALGEVFARGWEKTRNGGDESGGSSTHAQIQSHP